MDDLVFNFFSSQNACIISGLIFFLHVMSFFSAHWSCARVLFGTNMLEGYIYIF